MMSRLVTKAESSLACALVLVVACCDKSNLNSILVRTSNVPHVFEYLALADSTVLEGRETFKRWSPGGESGSLE